MLVEKNFVPNEMLEVIAKNGVNHVTILGGEAAVSQSVSQTLVTLPSN
ncbi:hypothetical protein AA0X95_06855 [Bacillus sp. 1P10SD]